MKVVVDFGEGNHVTIDIDKVRVEPDACILVKQLDDGRPLVAGISKRDAERYAPK